MGTKIDTEKTLKHFQPDRIPYNITFTLPARENTARFYENPDFESELGNCFTFLGVSRKKEWIEAGKDIWEDEFGVQWDRSIDKDIGNVCNQVITPDNLKKHVFPNPDLPERFDGYPDAIRNKKNETFIVASMGFSLFERAWTLAGMENLLVYMMTEKKFVHTLLDRILAFNLRIIEHACSYDIDVMRFGDDWGQQNGLIMGPALWHEFIKPRVKQMYAAVRSKSKYVMIHSCGKVDELFPELIEIGLDIFNPFQPEVMDVFDMKKKYGDKLSFYGGISTQKLLPYGTVAQVKDEVKRLLDVIGKDGGYIASPAHDIPKDAKPENIAAMIDALRSQ
ncbi:MAG: hypothetical protein JW957_08610 [Candidatus Omnitrophica bacterium]|nr:hypothetical protein [Candidatus Omnitrophota bacterium]